MPSDATRQPNFAALLGLAWLIVAAQLLLQHWSGTGQTLLDTDDAMRLTQMRAWLAGQGWFDLHQARLQPPFGYDSHWSRLIDAGLAGLFFFFGIFTDHAFAERFMRAIWPLLWLLPTMIGMVAIAWRIDGRQAALVALLLAILGIPAYQQFTPGRVDHHNVQITLALLTVAATLWSDRVRWCAAAAGLLTGLALAVGLESLPYVALCGAALALRYAFDPAAATAFRRYVHALGASTLAGFLVSVGPDRFMQSQCDAIAINIVAAIIAAVAVLAVTGRNGDDRRGMRVAKIALAALVAGAIYRYFEPRCFGGPFAMVDPEIWPIWLSEVREMQPLLSVFQKNPLTAAAIATFPAVALLASLLLVREPSHRKDFGFLTAAAVFVLAALTTLAAIRAYSYAIWFGMPLVAAFALRLFALLQLRSVKARLIAALLLTPMALSSGAITLASAAGYTDKDSFARPESRTCFQTANYAPLAQLPPGLVVTDVSFGPFLLALTPHAAMAGPYHRASYGIPTGHRALAAAPEEARDVLRGAKVDYVMICGPRPPDGLAEPARGRSLWGHLQAGAVPDWLEPIPGMGVFAVFRVKP